MRERREEALRIASLLTPPSADQIPSVLQDKTGDGVKPLAISVDTFCRITSLGRTACFALLREKRLEGIRVNRRTLISMRSVEALLGLNEERG
jgi:hypothetical protein